jgi:hypothetical protein
MTIRSARHLASLPLRGALVLAALLVCACGSSAHLAEPTAATGKTGQKVSAVLSDGPDPDADPVGYAEAQVLPLRQLHGPDKALGNAISQLASAYERYFASNGKSSTAKEAVAVASKRIDSFRPGAAS